MMKKIANLYFVLILFLLVASCSPKITKQVSKSYEALDPEAKVEVLGINDSIPSDSEILGAIKIGDSGFSTNCGYEVVIEKAKAEARKAGGNVLKITEHTPPDFYSTCHRIAATILKVGDIAAISSTQAIDSTLVGKEYALLHIYRYGGMGALVGLDLHVDDSVICRAKNNWKETVRIDKEGLITLWCRTEVKTELPVIIEFGREYYIRCGLTMGVFVGHPKMELVDNTVGQMEFQSIKEKKKKKNKRKKTS